MSATRVIEEPPPLTEEEAAIREAFEEDLQGDVEEDIVDIAPSDSDEKVDAFMEAYAKPSRGLHAKIAEVIQEVTYIQKTGTAPKAMGGYSFVEAGQIAAKLRIALATRGVTMLPEHIEQVGDILVKATSGGGSMFIQTIKTTWRLTDSESGETTTIESMGTGGDSGDKFSPKAQTNAMKYALQVGFLLETGDDPEKFDLTETPQGPGVEVGPSSIEGVRQGGRQTKATQVQLDEIRRHAKRLDLSPEAMAAIIGSALGGNAPDVDPEDELSDAQATVIRFLKELSFDEAGSIISRLDAVETLK